MSTKEEKEKQQQALDTKQQTIQQNKVKTEKTQRDKEVITLKAANQMLEDAKEKVRSKLADDPSTMNKLIGYIDNAQEQNLEKGRYQYNASENEINNSKYGEASKLWEDKYQKYLEDKGITDEEMRAKSSDDASGKGVKVVMSSDSKKEKEKKWFSFRKKKNEVDETGEEIVTEIDQTKRTVVGNGFIPDDGDDISPEDFMKEMEKKVEDEKKETNAPEKTVGRIDLNDKIETNLDIKDRIKSYEYPDFDPNTLSPLTRYDIIELPSHGECYKHKKGRIPVRELTASDENLIASPNMYASGQLLDTLLKRCILDKNFDVDEMCPGDRDAVILWLRASAYGSEYKIDVYNTEKDKTYKTSIDLSNISYLEFNLKGDENGYFDYVFENGDVAKFKILSFKETQEVQETIALKYINQKKYVVNQKINEIKEQVKNIFTQDNTDETLIDAIDYINEWSNKIEKNIDTEEMYSNFVTENLIKRTVSINKNEDRGFIEQYINNMKLSESKKYREFLFENVPGIDTSIEVQIPESDGGGSFNSFLRYEDTIFLQ